MQKQVNFFEQNVQWFALGLGGLFLLWTLFAYIMQPPVVVSVGGRELGPGEVEPATLDGPVKELKRDIANPSIPSIPQKDYVESFIAAIQGANKQLALLSPNQIRSTRGAGPVTPGGEIRGDGEVQPPVAFLPKPPPAKAGPASKGRSRVVYFDPNWEPPANRPNQVQEPIEADKDWWSGSFTISAEALAKAFTDAIDLKKIEEVAPNFDPTVFMQTAMLDVELVRQQILPGNRAGKEEIVKPLQHMDRPPFPGKSATEFEIQTYLAWATQNPSEIISPAFYEVIGGDLWVPPGEESEQLVAADMEQRRAERKMKIEQQRQEAAMRKQMAQQRRAFRAPPGAAFGDEEMAEMGMMDPDLAGMAARGRYMRPPPYRPGMPPIQRPPRIGGRQPAGAAPGVPIGPGKFDVTAIDDIQIIAHDDTVEAGKTYRYKIRYRILNPVWKSVRVAPPELTKQFAITSAVSDWTKPVTMRPTVEFFLAEISGDRSHFDVFELREGQMKKSRITASPGDAIGKSGWSVVDVRGSGRKAYGLLMDEVGQVVRREPEGSSPSDRYLWLLDEAGGTAVGLNR